MIGDLNYQRALKNLRGGESAGEENEHLKATVTALEATVKSQRDHIGSLECTVKILRASLEHQERTIAALEALAEGKAS